MWDIPRLKGVDGKPLRACNGNHFRGIRENAVKTPGNAMILENDVNIKRICVRYDELLRPRPSNQGRPTKNRPDT